MVVCINCKSQCREAGLEDVIKLKQMRLQDLKTDKINGAGYFKPPYGERLLMTTRCGYLCIMKWVKLFAVKYV